MEIIEGNNTFYTESAEVWRAWFDEDHVISNSIWLVIYRKENGKASVYYPEAMNEALCFGWMNSKSNKRSRESYYQYFSVQNPKSSWSKANKEKVVPLTSDEKIATSGLANIRITKETITRVTPDQVDELILQENLENTFLANQIAFEY
jgi:uncharacterized protein YdeI (YjbR/CyaY-like superfamily)